MNQKISRLKGMMKPASVTKIIFELDPSDWHGYETESVWAEPVSGNRYRIRNTPFYAKGVSFEDLVFVKGRSDSLFFESTSISAGHSTYRVILEKETSDADVEKYWGPLERLGCSYETSELGLRLLAVDVPPSADIYKVYSLLEHGEQDGVWYFEEGHCGHPLN